MRRYKCLYFIGITLVITACGGGGGGAADNPSSSVGSSSSSVPSEPYANCAAAEGGVFINNVCSPWRDVSVYEQRQNPFEWEEVTDGEGNAVVYSILNTEDPGHNQVLDIQFKNQALYAANVRMLSPETSGYDMSEFSGGKIIFD